MHYVSVAVCAGILVASVASAPVSAQTTVKRSPEEMRASYDAHKGDFDYLLGDWEFTAESKEYGKFRGLWSAVRLEGGQILDEYRVLGDNGDTMYMTTSLRNYNRALDRWELVGLDAGNGIQDIGTGRRVGSEMQIEQKFGVTTDKPSLWKIRYYDIAPDRFFWSADRSTDGGKTWVSKHQTIEARRIGPPRSFGALATGKKSTQSTPQAADPISGNWGSDDQTFLELKLDANNAVSGTAIWRDGSSQETRGPIKTGTFNPRTGAIRLEGEAKRPDTGATASYVIEGKLEKDTLAGTFTFDDRKGNFSFTRK
ncbi:MAG: hypothetical protein DMF84_06050 [Acidobacteria bacterium]|nr:MAG: hypothetical protein DMF84_06050 [Acidobacteriota bacterium]